MKELIPVEVIESKIHLIRGQKVMLDKDLAAIYGIKPIRLREQVKRNLTRFPEDFMSHLNKEEINVMVSQNAIPSRKHLGGYEPYVFTEQGVAMLSSILNSEQAIKINIASNHIHGIIVLSVGAGPCACPVFQEDECPDREGHRQGINKGHPQEGAPTRLALPDIVHRFKSFTTAQYRTNVIQNNWPPFPGKLWQRNYYEDIISTEDELNRIREYIVNNPARWAEDEDNPANLNRRQ
jgi:hypothetical protein